MIIETMENGMYRAADGDRILVTISSLGDNVYRAINKNTDITAEVIPLNDFETSLNCIEHKRSDKKGRYRKTNKLLDQDLRWLVYILEEKGFIRKAKYITD